VCLLIFLIHDTWPGRGRAGLEIRLPSVLNKIALRGFVNNPPFYICRIRSRHKTARDRDRANIAYRSIDVAIGPAHVPLPPASCFIGEMAYVILYALHLTPILPFKRKRQVLEPIKVPNGYLKAVSSR
jgi:hypothetical protein